MSTGNVVWVDECGSTNAAIPGDAPHGYTLAARSQTHGRGQRGNGWESAPGLNLTFSMMLRPRCLHVSGRMAVCMATALAVCEAVQPLLDDSGITAYIKWPNDIYVDGDRKLAGLLIENVVHGPLITRSIAGIGLNVNQQQFTSDAPNPVSLRQLTGREYDLQSLLLDIAGRLTEAHINDDGLEGLRRRYMQHLWRRQGWHAWRDAATGDDFTACIADVAADGRLTLRTPQGMLRSYDFKEVKPLLAGGLVSPTDR